MRGVFKLRETKGCGLRLTGQGTRLSCQEELYHLFSQALCLASLEILPYTRQVSTKHPESVNRPQQKRPISYLQRVKRFFSNGAPVVTTSGETNHSKPACP